MAVKATLARWLRLALTPSAFKVGVLVTLVAGAIFLAPAPRFHRFLESLDCRVHDLMFVARGPRPPTGQVVILDIDEKSLAELGQWPWPRDVMASLIRQLGALKPKIIGFDIVFAEPDRTSLKLAAERLARLTGTRPPLPADGADNDVIFAAALGEADTVLGYYFELPSPGTGAPLPAAATTETRPPCPEFSIPADAVRHLLAQSDLAQAVRPVLNLDCLNNTALTEGFFNTVPDLDGVTRRGTLFIRYGDMLYPSLTVEMVREGLRLKPELVGVPGVGVTAVVFGERQLPVTRQGQLCVNFRGPPRSFTYVSAVDVLNQRVDAKVLADKYVLIGTSAIGLLDLRATPFARAFPGVEINATIIDNLLAGDPMVYDKGLDLGLNLALVLLSGILLAAALAFLGPRLGALCGVVSLLLVGYGNYRLLFQHNQLVGVTYVVLALVGVLIAVSVSNYFFEGRRKRFIQGAFSHYVSETVVESLLRNPDKLSLEGEVRDLSILFSDIRGFTSISEAMTARQLSSFLNEYLSAMTDIIMEHGGTVDKFIGDAIMAFWGAPLDDTEHARHALTAALAMRQRLAELRPQWQSRGLPPVEIGIGINSGNVSVGNMGSRTRFSYTVMGDAVNLSSRLEGLTKIYGAGILVSEVTRRAAGDRFFYRPIDLVRVKGKREPVALFEPIVEGAPPAERRAELERFEAALGLYRARDFAACRDAFQALQADHPHTLHALYLERVELFLRRPPAADWDGVFTFTTKGHDED